MEIRTEKDKENQNTVDRLHDCLGDDEEGRIGWVESFLKQFLDEELSKAK